MVQNAKNFWVGILVVMFSLAIIGIGLVIIPDNATITSAIGLVGLVAGSYFAYSNR